MPLGVISLRLGITASYTAVTMMSGDGTSERKKKYKDADGKAFSFPSPNQHIQLFIDE